MEAMEISVDRILRRVYNIKRRFVHSGGAALKSTFIRIFFLVAICTGGTTRLAHSSEELQSAGSLASPGARYNARLYNVQNNTQLASSVRGVSIYIDNLFKVESHRRMLNSAARRYVGIAWDSEVLDCAFGSPRKNTPASRADFVRRLQARIGQGNAIYILHFAEPMPEGPVGIYGTLGIARVGLASNSIGINSTALVRYFGQISDFTDRVNALAGVIGHEIVHNLGVSHPVDSDGNQSFDDFVYIYGRCISKRLNGLS